MTQVWISAAGLCCATIVGSIAGFAIKELPHKWNDTVLGLCAGIMLAASILGLIVPAFEMSSQWWWSVAGCLVGGMFLNVLDLLTPHLHHITGMDPEEHKHNASINHVMLFVMAIALHKLPEGMAAGVSIIPGIGDQTDWTVSIGISLQNIPEGMVIIAPLLVAGVKPLRTFIISITIGLLEIIGVWIGYGMGNISMSLLPFMLSFAGGAMLYVTSDEMIPETHAHGYQKQATYALLIGFLTMLVTDRLCA